MISLDTIAIDVLLNIPNAATANLSIKEAEKLLAEQQFTKFAHKNLFLVEVSSALKGDFSKTFNAFCTAFDYNPTSLTGDKQKVGSAFFDLLNAREAIELNVTMLDDSKGTIRRWWDDHVKAAAPSDGSVGLPGRYAIKFKILHAFITRKSNKGGFEEKFLFRPSTLQESLIRGEDGLKELPMTFTQLDTFMPF